MSSNPGTALRILALAALCLGAAGQTITLTDVSRQRDALSRAKGLTEEERSEILGIYDKAALSLHQEIRWKAQQVGYTRTKAVIDNELATARSASSAPQPGPPPPPPSETVQQVDDELTRVRNDRASLVKRRDELTKLSASLVKRAEAIATRFAEIRENLQSIEDEISVLSLASASPQWEQASRMSLQSRRQALQQELLALGMERDSLELRRQLIPLQREAYLLKLESAEKYLNELAIRRTQARLLDAKKSLEATVAQARALAKGLPQFSALAAEIENRAASLWGPNGIEARTDQAAAHTEQMRVALARFQEIMANTRRRYENSGLFSSAGEWWPPKVERYGRPAEVGGLAIGFSAAGIVARRDVFRMEEERNSWPAFETELQQIVAAAGAPPSGVAPADLQSRARSLLQLKRSLMADLLASERTYSNQVDEAQNVAQDLLRSIRELQAYVLQRALWSRSVTGSIVPSPSGIADALFWFVTPHNWAQIAASFWHARNRWVFWLAGCVAAGALLFFRRQWTSWLVAPRAPDSLPSGFRTLLANLVRALLIALPIPLAIAYVGWVIGQAASEADLARSIAGGAGQAARFLFVCILVRLTLAPGAAADKLLGWSRTVCNSLDAAVRRLALVVTPLCFIATALAEDGMYPHADPQLQSHHNSLGRLCFLLAMFAFLDFVRRVLRPGGPAASALGPGYDSHGFARARIVRALLFLVFASAFLLALAGYYITAYLLVENTLKTAAFTFALSLVYGFIRQWRLDQEARLCASQGHTELAAARAADMQVRRLSHFGLTLVWIAGAFVIWSAALPSLSVLTRVELLPEFRIATDKTAVPGDQPPAAPPSKPQTQEVQPAQPVMLPVPAPAVNSPPAQPAEPREPLYLSGLLLAVFVGVLTSMLVGNIPGLLQFTVFRRLSLDTGGQYAINTIARYLVIIVGLIIISGILGLNWSKVQWLAAALTFGIGFGLQEIFANFAAGLILLLDRSIRVGDVVTVGELSGIVSRIQMRATTVTLWDRSDMVVPNKEFITAKLVNWTLSNPDTRVDMKVGVAYGSDVEQVREVLMQIATNHPAVLKNPEPQVLLTEFGASSINFELRVFGLFSYGRPVLLDELHRSVVREFKSRGIEIAFPQLDIHMKSQLPSRPD